MPLSSIWWVLHSCNHLPSACWCSARMFDGSPSKQDANDTVNYLPLYPSILPATSSIHLVRDLGSIMQEGRKNNILELAKWEKFKSWLLYYYTALRFVYKYMKHPQEQSTKTRPRATQWSKRVKTVKAVKQVRCEILTKHKSYYT